MGPIYRLSSFISPPLLAQLLSSPICGLPANSRENKLSSMDWQPRPIHDIAADISKWKLRLSALPRCHPLRPICAGNLAFQLLERNALSNQKDDLDKSILYLTETLLFSSHALLARGSMEPEDAISAAKYLRHLRDPAHGPFAFLRQEVTALLVETLAFQMELNASGVVQTLEEMAVLTHELLTSDPSSAFTTRAIVVLASSPHSDKLFLLLPLHLLNQIIELFRLARVLKPELREVPLFLAKYLSFLYCHTMNDGLDEAESILDEVIASGPPGDEF
ncbi:hypothetical protein V8E53_001522 [Lactarius tabidus]